MMRVPEVLEETLDWLLSPQNVKKTTTQGELGYLWTYRVAYYDSWRRHPIDPWCKHPIGKITPKRIFIIAPEYDRRQRLFDRAQLERDGYCDADRRSRACERYYTDAGRAVFAREPERLNRTRTAATFPLLALSRPFTRSDVIRAFRRRSLELHPDHGGEPHLFRRLLAERERALRTAREGEVTR